MRTILLLSISNIFMTVAWYGHLKFCSEALWKVIMVSWGMAFFEYCFQVPANRIGSYQFTAAQLKTIQEIITLSIFPFFSGALSRRQIQMELRHGFCFHRRRCILYLSQVVGVRCAGYAILPGGHTRTSCLRAKCRRGREIRGIPSDSVIELRASSASARCNGHGG